MKHTIRGLMALCLAAMMLLSLTPVFAAEKQQPAAKELKKISAFAVEIDMDLNDPGAEKAAITALESMTAKQVDNKYKVTFKGKYKYAEDSGQYIITGKFTVAHKKTKKDTATDKEDRVIYVSQTVHVNYADELNRIDLTVIGIHSELSSAKAAEEAISEAARTGSHYIQVSSNLFTLSFNGAYAENNGVYTLTGKFTVTDNQNKKDTATDTEDRVIYVTRYANVKIECYKDHFDEDSLFGTHVDDRGLVGYAYENVSERLLFILWGNQLTLTGDWSPLTSPDGQYVPSQAVPGWSIIVSENEAENVIKVLYTKWVEPTQAELAARYVERTLTDNADWFLDYLFISIDTQEAANERIMKTLTNDLYIIGLYATQSAEVNDISFLQAEEGVSDGYYVFTITITDSEGHLATTQALTAIIRDMK